MKKSKRRTLSKSRFITALECPTKLRYVSDKTYASNKEDNEFLQALAEGGFQVGELAKHYYPEGISIDEFDNDAALARTNRLLNRENATLFEAAVLYDDRFFIRVDILKKSGGNVQLIEVKAKSFNPDTPDFYYKRKDLADYIRPEWRPYLFDVAFQAWVVEHVFPEWSVTPYLMMADKTRVTTVTNLNQHFRIRRNEQYPDRKECYVHPPGAVVDAGAHILTKTDVSAIVDQIRAGEAVPQKDRNPDDRLDFKTRLYKYAEYFENPGSFYLWPVGKQCKDCEFKNDSHPELNSGFEECWKSDKGGDFDISEPHIFDIWFKPRVEDMLNDGIYYQKDVCIEEYFMKRGKSGELAYSGARAPRQALQVEKVINNDHGEDVKEKLFTEMKSWTFPLHFIDFETNMMAIPFNRGRRPYEQIAFQFSCHTYFADGSVIHDEWLNIEQGRFPNFDFVRALKEVLAKDNGTVFRYADHENTVLNQIRAQMLEDGSAELRELIDWIPTITVVDKNKPRPERAMVDLLKLVQKYYYQIDMGGSNSIKQVLPTVLKHSKFLKKKYREPLEYGTNLVGETFWRQENGKVLDPYKQLKPIYEDLNIGLDQYIDEKGNIRDGGAAMMAYSYLQFSDLDENRRRAIAEGLLRYCELDTLAMVMIYEHWKSLI